MSEDPSGSPHGSETIALGPTDKDETPRRPNLSPAAQRYLENLDANVEDLFHHVLAVLHDPAYREANSGALRMEWPRIPLPSWPDGNQDGAADELAESAARGRQLAALLDSDTPVPGVTEPIPGAPPGSALRPEIAAIAVPSTTDGGNMTADDFSLTAGWGHFGSGQAVMPGQGRAVERDYTTDERAALGPAIQTLGDTTFDIYLNDRAYWRNIPSAVWTYKLGGYQVLKKVALLPRAQSPIPPPPPRRSPTPNQHHPPHSGYTVTSDKEMICPNWNPSLRHIPRVTHRVTI